MHLFFVVFYQSFFFLIGLILDYLLSIGSREWFPLVERHDGASITVVNIAPMQTCRRFGVEVLWPLIKWLGSLAIGGCGEHDLPHNSFSKVSSKILLASLLALPVLLEMSSSHKIALIQLHPEVIVPLPRFPQEYSSLTVPRSPFSQRRTSPKLPLS